VLTALVTASRTFDGDASLAMQSGIVRGMNKAERMADVVARRRAAEGWATTETPTNPRAYRAIGDFHGGAYECEHVSPVSIAAHNLDADVMLMGQDWDSEKGCEREPKHPVLGYDPKLATNKRLDDLLRDTFGLTRPEVFFTNLFPFVKRGGMSTTIPAAHLEQAAKEFALPQVDIVRPTVVVCFGLATYNALAAATGAETQGSVAVAMGRPFNLVSSSATVWCQSHPGYWGRQARVKVGGSGQVERDWMTMKEVLGLGKAVGATAPE
jgi:hypothetical protein